MLSPAHQAFFDTLSAQLPADRLVTDPTRTLAYGTDASFYRLIPQIVIEARHEDDVRRILAAARQHGVAVTFRAAGTSLSGQSVTDSVLVRLGEDWNGLEVQEHGDRIRLQPGVIGAHANAALAPLGRKIGPDPASINTARIGGMAANNASGMCCGTRQNSYHTLAAIRVMLVDGTVLDTADTGSVAAFRSSHACLLDGLAGLAARLRENPALAERVRHKYRLKNTTGYGINALLDFTDPVDMLAHLMIGSEGTLGFISSITYATVPDYPHKASSLTLFNDLDACCRAVTALRESAPVEAVELIDARGIRAVQDKSGLPAFLYGDIPDGAAALLIDTRAPDSARLDEQCRAINTLLAGFAPAAESGFSTDAATIDTYWAVRKGLFPAVGAVRPVGTTVVIEDVAFPVEHLAEGVRRLTALFDRFGYTEALIFGHALEGNLHFVFTPGFDSSAEVQRYSDFMDAVSQLVAVEFGGSLKAEHGTGRNVAPFVRLEWGDEAYAIMVALKKLFDPAGLLNPDVIITDNPAVHLSHLKAMPAADPLVDRCIECGFCEPACPSNGLSLTPRQRIVLWRAMQDLRRRGTEAERLAAFEAEYPYLGIDTCAATGMCATRCPVGINTGTLMKQLKGPAAHPQLADWAAGHMDTVTGSARLGLSALAAARSVLGEDTTARLNQRANRLLKQIPVVPAATPRAAAPLPAPATAGEPVVYFVSCVNRTLAEGDTGASVAASTLNLFRKAGFRAIYPDALNQLCCGQPFDSMNANAAARHATQDTNAALLKASDNGRIPVYLDNGPCALRLIRAQAEGLVDARLQLFDAASFLHRFVAPRIDFVRPLDSLALHVPCSATSLGCGDALRALAQRCCRTLTEPDIACCGFAGDKGFVLPELNTNSLRRLPPALPAGCQAGVSMSRTCQIGLSSHSGLTYHSIEALLDAVSDPA